MIKRIRFMVETSENYIKLILDNDVLDKYNEYYFKQHPRAKKKPIEKRRKKILKILYFKKAIKNKPQKNLKKKKQLLFCLQKKTKIHSQKKKLPKKKLW